MYPCTICIGVTAAPWPIGRLPIVAPEYSLSFGTIPCSSPGNWTPVFLPKPNLSIHLLYFVAPIFWPISTAPMFEERARICADGQVLGAVFLGVFDDPFADFDLRRDVNSVCGVTSPSSSAAETVNALKVEPGS